LIVLVPTRFIPWESIAFRTLFGEMLQGLRLWLTASRQMEIQSFARLDQIALDEILAPAPFDAEWAETEADLVPVLGSDHLAHCTNPGDRRALYQLVRVLKPQNVLEAGTRFGVSALYIAAALSRNYLDGGAMGKLVTLDIADVDDPARPWASYGLKHSPRELIAAAGLSGIVEFVTARSTDFLMCDQRRFSLVYLDGSTAAGEVYRDLQLLPWVLSKNAVVLKHAFFPGGRRLWPNEKALAGCARALSRLQREGVPIAARPLGELPWPTKYGGRITSLALIGRTS
jgi:predicted O-methyltransferase YrrM